MAPSFRFPLILVYLHNLKPMPVMRISNKYKVREMAGQHVVIIQGRNGEDMTRIISLNKTSLFLWNSLYGKDFEIGDVACVLMREYGIDEDLAMKDAGDWCAKLEECKLLA